VRYFGPGDGTLGHGSAMRFKCDRRLDLDRFFAEPAFSPRVGPMLGAIDMECAAD
jgi:hypothetical protein